MTTRKPQLIIACALASASAFAQTTGTSTPNDPTTMPEPRMMQMDKDGDGKISKKEADRKMIQNWDKWDVNQDGMIDSAEYSAGGVGSGGVKPKN